MENEELKKVKEESELFGQLKLDIGKICWDNLFLNEAKTAIEANPTVHKIAKYVEQKLFEADWQKSKLPKILKE